MKNILIVGDIIRDDYIECSVTRMAQEANIPVIDAIGYPEHRLGGAANVAENVKCLSSKDTSVYLSGIFDSETINLTEYKSINPYKSHTVYGDGLIKTRYYSGNNIIARIDNEFKYDDNDCGFFSENFIMDSSLDKFDVVLISDYDKGTITNELAKFLVKNSKFCVVDSKRKDLSIYEGADVLKINMQEYAQQDFSSTKYVVEKYFNYVIITNGKNGSILRQYEEINKNSYRINEQKFETIKSNQVDVTGCGDVHAAAFCVSMIFDKDIRKSINFANVCASLAVRQFGTTKINKKDLKENGYEIAW